MEWITAYPFLSGQFVGAGFIETSFVEASFAEVKMTHNDLKYGPGTPESW
ncbi:MAG: hypothetical protein ABSA78_07520 [Candidatus Sulfotelmatobacter sp.]|jgi:hypothetical protein